MFVISKKDSYVWPVVIEIPVDGGKFEKHTFDAEFKRVTQERILELLDLIDKQKLNDMDFCREVLVGWKGVTDGESEIPFSESSRDEVLNIAGVASAIATAFFLSRAKARTKN